ncbi:hypothetical protein I4U23_010902 [Adineta vaga]|nr:hypothetical protein I4U23_010902 [Adineta vaga]
MSFRTIIILATIDRYVVTNSRLKSRRSGSIKIARRTIILSIFVFQLITFGIFPSILMIVFGAFFIGNLRQSLMRLELCYTKNILRKRDNLLWIYGYVEIISP